MIRLSSYSNSEFDRGAPAWKEALWWVFRSLLFAPWFPVPSVLKVAVLRSFGASVGTDVVIRSRVNITFPWKLEIGDHVWIGDEVMILSLAPVRIGANSCISQRAFICTGSHDYRKDSFDLVTLPVSIGESCWVGANVFIGPGVDIAPGSVCAAGAVVVKSVGPHQVVGGNPARMISSSLPPCE